MDPLVSIVIPAFNAEKSIYTCLESVCHQLYKNIEIIVINDGSEDNTLEIIQNYAKLDSRIIIIDQQNLGVSSARNAGINKSRGEYIGFVDSDDTISEEFVSKLIEKIMKSHSDMAICQFESEQIESNVRIDQPDQIYTKDEFLNQFYEMLTNLLVNRIWGKLYNSSIIKENNIRMIPELDMGEDLCFNLAFIEHLNNIIVTNDVLYYYDNKSNYLTCKYRPNLYDIRVKSTKYFEKFIKTNGVKGIDVSDLYIKLFYAEVISNLENGKGIINKSDRKKRIKDILQREEIKWSLSKESKSRAFKLMKFVANTKNSVMIEVFAACISIVRKKVSNYSRVSV